TDKVIECFQNPKNVGEIENADGVGEVGSPACGDIMKMYLKIENDIIVDVKFKTFGCGAAVATSSKATEMILGKTLEEAEKLTNSMVIDELGGLPQEKVHCSVLAEQAIKSAILDYKSKSK
ncbi:MAG: Fe-S cluster assembly scaffold protein NifU, partial [Eubacteriaceae bacterium]|nr:Fe-S cluster assembly scaffold protein NifU [Eubacteriaceae bacterium]